jgi:hypothetical protein
MQVHWAASLIQRYRSHRVLAQGVKLYALDEAPLLYGALKNVIKAAWLEPRHNRVFERGEGRVDLTRFCDISSPSLLSNLLSVSVLLRNLHCHHVS